MSYLNTNKSHYSFSKRCFNVACLYWIVLQSAAQNITINKYNQSNSLTTCSTGLRHDLDTFVFTSQVSFGNKTSEWSSLVSYEHTSSQSPYFTAICHVNITKGCNGFLPSPCYCQQLDQDNVLHMVVNVTAKVKYSRASIRGYLYSQATKQFYSNIQQVPEIFDSQSVVLHLNGAPLQKENCQYHFKHPEPAVTFCCLNTAQPCEATVLFGDSDVAVGSPCVTYQFNKTHQSNSSLVLGYKVCNSSEWAQEYRCFFTWDNADHTTANTGIIVTVVLVLIALVCCTVGGVYYFYRRKKGIKTSIQVEQTKPMM